VLAQGNDFDTGHGLGGFQPQQGLIGRRAAGAALGGAVSLAARSKANKVIIFMATDRKAGVGAVGPLHKGRLVDAVLPVSLHRILQRVCVAATAWHKAWPIAEILHQHLGIKITPTGYI
jgi:hypothetical protein